MDVALGVREWKRRVTLSPTSGGFESYTKVSSESEVLASSTALAILASKISALDDPSNQNSLVQLSILDRTRLRGGEMKENENENSPFPLLTGCLREDLFFSFLGLIVSVLCFVLKVPFMPSGFGPTVSATWGMLDTVSVSTVIVWVDPSGLAFACLDSIIALDCLERRGGGTEVVLLALVLSPPFSWLGSIGLARNVRPPSISE
jgi:hypothetical protein